MLIEAQGSNLRSVLEEMQLENFEKSTIMKIAIQTLDLLETLHKNCFVHGDLKLENIVVGSKDKNKLYLIDFGLAQKFVTAEGKHVEQQNLKTFSGNILFASLNSCRGYNKSRRDDIESLIYIVIYHLNNKYLPWSELLKNCGGP